MEHWGQGLSWGGGSEEGAGLGIVVSEGRGGLFGFQSAEYASMAWCDCWTLRSSAAFSLSAETSSSPAVITGVCAVGISVIRRREVQETCCNSKRRQKTKYASKENKSIETNHTAKSKPE